MNRTMLRRIHWADRTAQIALRDEVNASWGALVRKLSVSRAIGALDTVFTRLGPTRRAYVLQCEALWSRPQGEIMR